MRVGILVAVLLAGCLQSTPMDSVDEPVPVAEAVVAMGDGSRVLADLKAFTELAPRRYDNQFQHDAARDWLEDELAAAGWSVARQKFSGPAQVQGTADGQNIVATLPGATDTTIILGAHYDSAVTSVEAAYDDGTGTMLMVELARALAQRSWNHTLVIAAFDQEEAGLVGSSFMAQQVTADEVPVRLMMNYDMVGINWPAGVGGTVNPIPVDFYVGGEGEGELAALWTSAAAGAGYPAQATTTQTGLGGGSSDHGPFRNADIPAAWLRGALIGSYAAYHNVDTVEAMTAVVAGEENLVAGFQTVLDLTIAFLIELDQN